MRSQCRVCTRAVRRTTIAGRETSCVLKFDNFRPNFVRPPAATVLFGFRIELQQRQHFCETWYIARDIAGNVIYTYLKKKNSAKLNFYLYNIIFISTCEPRMKYEFRFFYFYFSAYLYHTYIGHTGQNQRTYNINDESAEFSTDTTTTTSSIDYFYFTTALIFSFRFNASLPLRFLFRCGVRL